MKKFGRLLRRNQNRLIVLGILLIFCLPIPIKRATAITTAAPDGPMDLEELVSRPVTLLCTRTEIDPLDTFPYDYGYDVVGVAEQGVFTVLPASQTCK